MYQDANDKTENQIQKICNQYHLKSCKTVMIENLPSPFIFGIIRPILILPANTKIDDKVILHELLHLKYKDSLQCIIWAIVKVLHWCNPFLQYIVNQINNDLEILCDQRVLELIVGEERRDYGRILLIMTNKKYPYTFATTSIANGANNIKKRIKAIVRFKQYPRGMNLISICISILLLPLAITGVSSVPLVGLNDDNTSSFAYHLSMASARLQKCTLAGAIDTYVKGILKKDN